MKRRDRLIKYCDCGDRQWTKCRHPWHFNFLHKGKRTRVSLHKVANKPLGYMMSKTEADAIADELRTQIRDGHCPAIKNAERDEITVAQLAERYVRERVNVAGRKADPIAAATNYVRIIRRLVVGGKPFEQHRLPSVAAEHLEELREARRAELRETARLRAEGKTKGRIVLPLEKDGEIGVEH